MIPYPQCIGKIVDTIIVVDHAGDSGDANNAGDAGDAEQLSIAVLSSGLIVDSEALGDGVAGMQVMLKEICSVDGDVKIHAGTV